MLLTTFSFLHLALWVSLLSLLAWGANHYEILGVPINSTRETIDEAYFLKLSEAKKERDSALESAIREAYKTLSDSEERGRYNRILDTKRSAEVKEMESLELESDLREKYGLRTRTQRLAANMMRMLKSEGERDVKVRRTRYEAWQAEMIRRNVLQPANNGFLLAETERNFAARQICASEVEAFLASRPNLQDLQSYLSLMQRSTYYTRWHRPPPIKRAVDLVFNYALKVPQINATDYEMLIQDRIENAFETPSETEVRSWFSDYKKLGGVPSKLAEVMKKAELVYKDQLSKVIEGALSSFSTDSEREPDQRSKKDPERDPDQNSKSKWSFASMLMKCKVFFGNFNKTSK